MSAETNSPTGSSIPFLQALAWAGLIIVVVAGGTYTLMTSANSSHISALETQIKGKDDRLKERDEEVIRLKNTAADSIRYTQSSAAPTLMLPDTTLKASPDSAALEALAKKVSGLERERNELIGQIAQISKDALDPASELGNLLTLLSKGTKQEQRMALKALFQLKDPRSFQALSDYFRTADQLTLAGTPFGDWYRLFLEFDQKKAMGFLLEQLESNDAYHADAAFDYLKDFHKKENLEFGMPILESIALRSSDSTARTRAKVLLRDYKEELAKPNTSTDNRSLVQIVLDVEKEIKKIPKTADPVSTDKK